MTDRAPERSEWVEPSAVSPRRRRAERVLLLGALVVAVVHATRSLADAVRLRGTPSRAPAPLAVDLARDPAWRLTLLPGIGPVRAEAIVEDRGRHGPIHGLDQLVRVRGIGRGVVRSLREPRGIRVRVRGQPVAGEPR